MPPLIVTDFYSDHDMQCPREWYGGFKEGRVIRFGDGERALSNMWTGDWSGSTFSLTISDFDRKLRRQLASLQERYWTEPLTIRMTTRANRAILGIPYTIFVGKIIEVQPERDLALNLTLGDIISEGILSDQHQVPWRQIRDGFLDELDVSESLDLDAPEPTIYGRHSRIPDISPASPQGFQYTPTYLGIETTGSGGSPVGLGSPGDQFYVWMVCGHACADIPDVLVWDHDEEGGLATSTSKIGHPAWFIPHVNMPAFEDRRSRTFGNDRRYTLIRARVDDEDANAVISGEKTLAVFVDGVEPVGDGSGEMITDRIQQYKHWIINYVVNRGPESYQSGTWLTSPSWSLFDGTVSIVDEPSFDACSAIAEERLPEAEAVSPLAESPNPAGYIGAAIIGASASDRSSVRTWISAWNRSCAVQFGVTHEGQLRVVMLHPTEAIKALAPLYTDAYEILHGSFNTDYLWGDKVNRIPWRADFEHSSGQWKTSDVLSIDTAIELYGKEILGEVREFPFAPGVTAASHLALLEAYIRVHPPRMIRFEATVGPNPVTGESLGYLDLGDYVRYKHYAAVGAAEEIRLAFITRHQVQGGKRRVMVEALDCDDLIGYDAFEQPGVLSGALNDSCENAIDVAGQFDELGVYTLRLNISGHGLDLAAPVLSEGPGVAHHAAWWKYTPTFLQKGYITTGGSDYDTVLGFLSGTCGSLSEIAANDNDGIFQTSFIDVIGSGPLNFLPGVTYYFLVHSKSDLDVGVLEFSLVVEDG